MIMIASVQQMTIRIDFKAVVLLVLIWTSCQSTSEKRTPPKTSLSLPELYKDSAYQVFVETPVGSMISFSYDIDGGVLDTVKSEDFEAYLPYPVNYGFFPVKADNTIKKIPVWILAKRLPEGLTLSVKLLGVIDYIDRNIKHREWLVIPVDENIQTIHSTRFRDFIIKYDPVKFTFEYWLKNRHGIGSVSQIIWHDEEKAMAFLQEEINK
jgi:inorganic pyrophosphatase